MRQPWRLDERGQRLLDFTLAGFLVFTAVAGTLLGGFVPLVGALCTLQFLPLFWRRTRPIASAAGVVTATSLQALAVDTPIWGQVAIPVTVYSVARFANARWGFAVLSVGFVGAAVASYDWLRPYSEGTGPTAYVSYFLTIAAIVSTAWALGTLGRTRAAYVDSLVERGERLEREAAQQAQLAAQDERARIAREMHDVVAHGLSVIVVQADGARYAAAKDPDAATRALDTISQTGRESLTEMRRMLGLLRSETGSGTAPQPGVQDLPHLVDEARAGGMPLEADLPDPMPTLPDGVALTVYRIAQEALSNVRKHAGVAQVRLTLLHDHGEVRLDVVDDGRGAAAIPDGKGLGLLGMRERVTVHGGTLTAGPVTGGGFRVSARIPA
ncbi:sensor histidine kinase [Nocardioides sp. JQ2195]|uniref:sensor histidine kinase n=1 Tax=Nocardioides sp. JQ2195 TaxID=2592334 RepID=UPI00143E12BA|nr:sensor histidine kinase [Nocardioides sp. JQ2195]QIX28260.1 sensor histidine kinase [Nocardioides sp. JQ2195]